MSMTTRGPGPPRTGAGVEEEEDGAAAGAADRRRGAGEEAWERGRPIECVTFVRSSKHALCLCTRSRATCWSGCAAAGGAWGRRGPVRGGGPKVAAREIRGGRRRAAFLARPSFSHTAAPRIPPQGEPARAACRLSACAVRVRRAHPKLSRHPTQTNQLTRRRRDRRRGRPTAARVRRGRRARARPGGQRGLAAQQQGVHR